MTCCLHVLIKMKFPPLTLPKIFLIVQLFNIRDCPNDINEAVCSLIFASARCGELPELCVIRKLFGERYGEKFVTTAVELSPGNLVNKQVLIFSSKSVMTTTTTKPCPIRWSLLDGSNDAIVFSLKSCLHLNH